MELDKSVMDYFRAVYDDCNAIEFTYDKKIASIFHCFLPLLSTVSLFMYLIEKS